MSDFIELQALYKYLPDQVSQQEKNDIGHFNLFKVEDLLLPLHKKVTYSRRNYFKISLVTGKSKIHYADQSINIDGTALVFTNPMVPYFWERISEEHTGYVCVFTADFFSKFGNIHEYPVFKSADCAIIALSTDEAITVNNLFVRMLDELQGDYNYKYDLLRNLLMEVVHGAQKKQPTIGSPLMGSNAAERITALFLELLERQFPIELTNQRMKFNSPSTFAIQLNIHVNHLNKALKETTGQTTSQLINDRLVQEARILLKSTNWSVAEIAWSLGFEEPNHFSSFFKSRTKITPIKFRQQID